MTFKTDKDLKVMLTATDGGKKSFCVPANAPDFHTRMTKGIIQASGGQAIWLDLENPETKQRIRIFVPSGRYGRSGTRCIVGGGVSDDSILACVPPTVTTLHQRGYSAVSVTGAAGRFTVSVDHRDAAITDQLADTTDVETVGLTADNPDDTRIRDHL